MKIITNISKIIPILFLVLTFAACSDDDSAPSTQLEDLNIVERAVAAPALSNLVAALQAANGDLPSVLSGPGPFTVLAPTNDAFAKIPKIGTIHKTQYQVCFLKIKRRRKIPTGIKINQLTKTVQTPKAVATPFPPLNFK